MAFGWSGFVSKALLLSMNWLHQSLAVFLWMGNCGDYGHHQAGILAADRVQHRSMKRMQALQPQLAALKEKYKDEPQKFNQKQWEFIRKTRSTRWGAASRCCCKSRFSSGFCR